MSEKISDWICICAAGQSVLGEPIKEEVIQEAADNYDTSFYTAMIWPNHPWPEVGGYLAREMYTYNLGRVVEMKAEREGGVLKLFARYAPNQFLINLNNDGQRLFSSAEFDLDFQGEGKIYMTGVTATDIPASTHTQMMQFSAANKRDGVLRSDFNEFSLGALSEANKKEQSLFSRFFPQRFNQQKLSVTDIQPEEDPEKMEALKALIEKIAARLDALEGAAKGDTTTTTSEAADEVQGQAEEIAILAEEVVTLAEEVAENPEDEVVKAEFSAAKAQFAEKFQAFTAADPTFATRKRRAAKAFSAARQQSREGSLETAALRQELKEMKQLLSAATGKSVTRTPSGAPATEEKVSVL